MSVVKPRKPKKPKVPKMAPVPAALIEAGVVHWVGQPPHHGAPFAWKKDSIWFWSKGIVFEFDKNNANILRRDEDGKWWHRQNRGKWYAIRNGGEVTPCALETWMDAQLVSWLNQQMLGGPDEGEEGRLHQLGGPADQGGTQGHEDRS